MAHRHWRVSCTCLLLILLANYHRYAVTAFAPPFSRPIHHRSVPLPITTTTSSSSSSSRETTLSPSQTKTARRTALWAAAVPTTTNATCSRREILTNTAAAQVVAAAAAAALVVAGSTTPAVATDTAANEISSSSSPWDAVRQELYDPNGGVAYLQSCLDQRNFAAVLAFTKEYDQILRKAAMGQAKKTLHDKAAKEQATAACNAVTFDLIGMNRNARPGQENYEQAVKYLQELKQDAEALLALEGK